MREYLVQRVQGKLQAQVMMMKCNVVYNSISEQGISCASFDKDGNKTELWDIPYNNSSDYKKVLDFLDRFEKDANLKFPVISSSG